ncbi:hypothetical protein pdam_00016389 [Pocillopora damicornis]|uniref:Uncharacterized protein n=1 Tax=Pocillopora damicornis TaxID=46731 RepID=A0A3M6V0B0_POCDA|nr:hypothetical protein pdam_00016389 [Pocillopora damicornis]
MQVAPVVAKNIQVHWIYHCLQWVTPAPWKKKSGRQVAFHSSHSVPKKIIAVKKEQERYSVLLYSVVNQQKRISRCAALFQKSHTPVKTQQFKHTSDGTKLIIHNLTKYSFQYSGHNGYIANPLSCKNF